MSQSRITVQNGNIRIREALADDLDGIVDIHCSIINKWYRDPRHQQGETVLEELSPLQRFWNGGPWVAVQSLKTHTRWMKKHGAVPIIAETLEEGRIVGHLDLWFSYEPQPYGLFSFIDVMAVHRDFQRKGIGSRLIECAALISKRKKCRKMMTTPEKDALAFYEANGFIVFDEFTKWQLDTTLGKEESLVVSNIQASSRNYDEVKDLLLITRPLPDIAANHVWWNYLENMGVWTTAHANEVNKCFVPHKGVETKIVFFIEQKGRLLIWMHPRFWHESSLVKNVLEICLVTAEKAGLKHITCFLPKHFGNIMRIIPNSKKIKQDIVISKALC